MNITEQEKDLCLKVLFEKPDVLQVCDDDWELVDFIEGAEPYYDGTFYVLEECSDYDWDEDIYTYTANVPHRVQLTAEEYNAFRKCFNYIFPNNLGNN